MKHFKAIASMSENRVIGRNGQLPWHLTDDLKWFSRMTMGNTIVMGRKTFESVGVLPDRQTVVLSRYGQKYPGVKTISTLDEIDVDATPEVFICGGGELYSLALPRCSYLYLTRVKKVVTGDTYFPVFEHRFELVAMLNDTPEFSIEHHRNKFL